MTSPLHSQTISSAATPAHWKAEFERAGYVIIRSAISVDKAAFYRDKQFSWLESFRLGFDRHNSETWHRDCVPANFKEGIYAGYGLAHEKFMWEARLEPTIIQAFAHLWGTPKLLVSFDGMNVTPPQTSTSDVRIPPWPHTDQHPADRNFLCAQGLLNTGPCGPKDGGLIVVEGSAALWDDFWTSEVGKAKLEREGKTAEEDAQLSGGRKLMSEEQDLALFSPKEIAWFERQGCKPRKLELKPGDLVLWDSRTIHYNCAPQDGKMRSAIYLCYAPAELSTYDDMQRKVGMFYGFQGSNHWPHINVRSTGEGERPKESHEWTDRMLELAGVEPYMV